MRAMSPAIRTFRHEQFAVESLIEAKDGRGVSVCIPARNEASTIGAVVQAVLSTRRGTGQRLVDEVLVVDDGSTDATADTARVAGARVLGLSPGGDKGRAMAAALESCNRS